MRLKSYINKYFISNRWWLLSGTIFFLIYFALFIYIQKFHVWMQYFSFLLIILLIGGLLAELLSKSKDIAFIVFSGLTISIYQGILFYIIYYIGFQNIIYFILTRPEAGDGPIAFPIEVTVGLTFYVFTPVNICGGLLGAVILFFIRHNKSHKNL
jgi:hypothetical protein